MSGIQVSQPSKLSAAHDLSEFDSGEPILGEWLHRRAVQNEANGASRTYVVSAGNRVVGYYTLAVGAVAHAGASGRIRRNMPDPVPVMVLGRLAVDKAFQRRGIGAGLLRDALLRTVHAADIAGIRAMLVHAISAETKRFYEGFGFIASPLDPLTVVITIADAKKTLGETARR